MEYMTALGRCAKCGQDKIQVEGNTKCLTCDVENTGGSGLVVHTEDPGHDALDRLLAKAGVASIPGGKPPAPVKPNFEAKQTVIASQVDAKEAKQAPIDYNITSALNILRSLPMPKDLKQFKQIAKAIKILESLGA